MFIYFIICLCGETIARHFNEGGLNNSETHQPSYSGEHKRD